MYFETLAKKFCFFTLSFLIVYIPKLYAYDLEQAYHLALKNDPKLATAQANLKVGLELKKIALSHLLPQVTATSTLQKADRDSNGEFPITLDDDQNPLTAEIRALRASNSNSDERTKTWGASINQVVFDLSTWFDYKKGQFESAQAKTQYQADQQDLIYRLLNQYILAIKAQKNVHISESLVSSEQKLYQQSKRLKKVGVNTNIDVFQAEAALDTSIAQQLVDEDTLTQSLQELSYITGETTTELWLIDEQFTVDLTLSENESDWVAKALENNFDIKISQFAMKASKANARSVASQHSLRINAEVKYTNTHIDTFELDNSLPFDFESRKADKSVMIQATLPLFAGGGISAKRRHAKSQYNSARSKYIDTIKDTQRMTLTALKTTERGLMRISTFEKALESNARALKATKRAYEVGTRGLSDVIDAQKSYYQIRRSLNNTRIDTILNLLKLKQLVATLSPNDVAKLNGHLLKPDTKPTEI